jgi:hypothetical protein
MLGSPGRGWEKAFTSRFEPESFVVSNKDHTIELSTWKDLFVILFSFVSCEENLITARMMKVLQYFIGFGCNPETNKYATM